MNIVHTRREKLIEARNNTQKLIRLTAEKIVTLTKMQEAIEQQIDYLSRSVREKYVTTAELEALQKTLTDALNETKEPLK